MSDLATSALLLIFQNRLQDIERRYKDLASEHQHAGAKLDSLERLKSEDTELCLKCDLYFDVDDDGEWNYRLHWCSDCDDAYCNSCFVGKICWFCGRVWCQKCMDSFIVGDLEICKECEERGKTQ